MRHRDRPGKKQLYASAGVHVVAVVLAWTAQVSATDPMDFITYEITLVSPPPANEAPEPEPVVEEEVVVETPEPVLAEEPPPVVEEKTRVEERPKPTPTPTPPPPQPEPVKEAGDPEPSETVSGEDLNIRMEGLRAGFPGVLREHHTADPTVFRVQGWGTVGDLGHLLYLPGRDGGRWQHRLL